MILNPGEIKLNIPSESGYLELIRTFVVQLADRLGFDDDSVDQIELAVDEACTNVVKYAYQEVGRENKLDVTLEVEPKRLTVIISDYGVGFDQLLLPSWIDNQRQTAINPARAVGRYSIDWASAVRQPAHHLSDDAFGFYGAICPVPHGLGLTNTRRRRASKRG